MPLPIGEGLVRLADEDANPVAGWIGDKPFRRPHFTGNRSCADGRQGRRGESKLLEGVRHEDRKHG